MHTSVMLRCQRLCAAAGASEMFCRQRCYRLRESKRSATDRREQSAHFSLTDCPQAVYVYGAFALGERSHDGNKAGEVLVEACLAPRA